MGSHSLLKEIFLTQGSNPGLLHCRQILYHLRHQGSPQQANKSKDELLGQGITTLFRKIANWEDGGLVPPSNSDHLAWVRKNSGSFYANKGECKVRPSLVLVSLQRQWVNWFPSAATHRWAWWCSSLWAKQKDFNLMLIPGKQDSQEFSFPHSSSLAWRIPWTEEPGGLQSMGSQRVGYNWAHMHKHTGSIPLVINL